MTGSGTIGDPYIISSKADLQAIDSDMTAYYELANDIDCAHAWTTLSSDDFTGHLDGKGFKITHISASVKAIQEKHVVLNPVKRVKKEV